jgi:KUP system potassium uptake protein
MHGIRGALGVLCVASLSRRCGRSSLLRRMSEASPQRAGHGHAATGSLTLAALGVVYGDIGTSPLYALQTVFAEHHGAVAPTHEGIFGVLSMVFWSITLVVSIRFVGFIMRADNQGEGGILALVALIRGTKKLEQRSRTTLIILGLFGVGLFYGDAMLTPAISVLSAVEGVEIAAPSLESIILPATLGVIIGLFAIQRHGTAAVGRLFGPVMILWFTALSVSGISHILDHPQILGALSPTHAIGFAIDRPGTTFIALGAVVLTITGAEALYADMGHFGRIPITRAWFFAVFPALILNYFGQGALIYNDPSTISNPFYLMFPGWAQIPMVILATAATLIASQAVISGAFSVTRQAVRLGYLPRVSIRHTAESAEGQIYIPAVNWALLVAVIALVLVTGASAQLTAAYGIAVTGTLLIDSLLFLTIARLRWGTRPQLIALGAVAFMGVDLTFLAANLSKIAHGGWIPVTVGSLVFFALWSWRSGSRQLTAKRMKMEGPVGTFLDQAHRGPKGVRRVPGAAVYMSPGIETTPLALRATLDHVGVLHETVLIVSVKTADTPYVAEADRLFIDDLGDRDDGISYAELTFGFMEAPDVTGVLGRRRKEFERAGVKVHPYTATFFVSQVAVRAPGGGLRRLPAKLFTIMNRNASSSVEFYRLPPERVLSVGARIDI